MMWLETTSAGRREDPSSGDLRAALERLRDGDEDFVILSAALETYVQAAPGALEYRDESGHHAWADGDPPHDVVVDVFQRFLVGDGSFRRRHDWKVLDAAALAQPATSRGPLMVGLAVLGLGAIGAIVWLTSAA